MKLKFDANLQYQQDAIEAAVAVFEGQPSNDVNYSTTLQTFDTELFNELGVSNHITLSPEQILANTQMVQEDYDLPVT